jgi:hypothetical protein
MRRGRKPYEEQARAGITEARHWPSPVRIGAMCALLLVCDASAVRPEPWAALARRNGRVNLRQRRRYGRVGRFCHDVKYLAGISIT